VTHKYYEIHAINSDKAIGLNIFTEYFIYRQPHGFECQFARLCME